MERKTVTMDTNNWQSTSQSQQGESVKSDKINVGTTERILSVGAGFLLAVLGLRGNKPSNIAMTLAGGALIFRGVSGYCPVNAALGRNTADTGTTSLEVFTTIEVSKEREEVYAYWRRLENLSRFMSHIKSVYQYNDVRSRWEAELAGLGVVSWEADIMLEERGRYLAWKSIEGSQIENAGEVRFTEAGPGKTEIQVSIKYRLPESAIGVAAARLMQRSLENIITEDIKRFKKVIESDKVELVNY
ncbi:MAG TPA: YgaP-like transmembrane domain [Cytophagaceae bacterium]